MEEKPHIAIVIGPTASGKSSRAVALAEERNGEVISVDSRQVYRTLDIGTEKTTTEEMRGIPHHLIDIREPEETYTAGDFAEDATGLIKDISGRGKLPILAGGTHFYIDALLYGLPSQTAPNQELRRELEVQSESELYEQLKEQDPRRARLIDPKNKRRLVRALEIIRAEGAVPERTRGEVPYSVEWIIIDPPKEELQARIGARLTAALERGLLEEVERTRKRVGEKRLNELGLEYRIVGDFLRGELPPEDLFPKLSNKLWHYARHQKAWLRKLKV